MSGSTLIDALLIVLGLTVAALVVSVAIEARRMRRMLDRLEGVPEPQKCPGFWARVWNR